MRKQSISSEEAKWQAEDDARTLERAMEIQADKKRIAAAHKVTVEKLKNVEAAVKMTGKLAGSTKKGRKK